MASGRLVPGDGRTSEAALLGVASSEVVVFDHAISGVQAGRAGAFCLVSASTLGSRDRSRREGRDIVVTHVSTLAPWSRPEPTGAGRGEFGHSGRRNPSGRRSRQDERPRVVRRPL